MADTAPAKVSRPRQPSRARKLLRPYQLAITMGCFLWCIGVWGAVQLGPAVNMAAIVGLVGFFLLAIIASFVGRFRLPLLLAFFCLCAGAVYWQVMQFKPAVDDISLWTDKPVASVDGIVTGLGSHSGQWIVQVHRLDGQTASGKILARLGKNEDVQPDTAWLGQAVKVEGGLFKPQLPAFPDAFNYRQYLLHQGITATMRAKSITIQKSAWAPWQWGLNLADRTRLKVKGFFEASLPPSEASLLGSMVLGDKAVPTSDEMNSRFRDAGLLHLLAASGLNVGLVGLLFLGLGKLLRLPRKPLILMAMLGVAFYACLTGLPPSVQRAAAMLEISLLLKFYNRSLQPLTLLAVAATALIVWSPDIVEMIGFQLSVISTAGLLAMTPHLLKYRPAWLPHWVADFIAVPLVAQLWVTPALLYHFQTLQVFSVPANMAAFPIAILCTYIGFILGGLSLLAASLPWQGGLDVLSALLGYSQPLLALLYGIASAFASLPWATFTIAGVNAALVVLLFMMLWQLTVYLRWPAKSRLAGLMVLVVLIGLPGTIAGCQLMNMTKVAVFNPPSNQSSLVLLAPNRDATVILPRLNGATLWPTMTYLKVRGVRQIGKLLLLHQPGPSAMERLKRLWPYPINQIKVIHPSIELALNAEQTSCVKVIWQETVNNPCTLNFAFFRDRQPVVTWQENSGKQSTRALASFEEFWVSR